MDDNKAMLLLVAIIVAGVLLFSFGMFISDYVESELMIKNGYIQKHENGRLTWIKP